uniref:Uncharacterized protein n=1 Tax=Kalanchoe fedtschenkoi TaxID=63787 RepID=A0A7N0UX83_KALFE
MVGTNGEHLLAAGTITPHTAPKRSIQSFNGQTGHTQFGYLNENGECWIKSDANYLVLEL